MGDFSKEGLSFEKAVQELENIIDSLEAGEVPAAAGGAAAGGGGVPEGARGGHQQALRGVHGPRSARAGGALQRREARGRACCWTSGS